MQYDDTWLKRDLKARGWTDGLISSLLGDPDKVKQSPRHRSVCYHIYYKDRVLRAEKKRLFRESLERRKKRKSREATSLGADDKTLARCLHALNKAAKRHRDAGMVHYENRSHGLAGYAKIQKEACYDLKGRVIEKLLIEGRMNVVGWVRKDLYLLEMEGFTFHSYLGRHYPVLKVNHEEAFRIEAAPLRVFRMMDVVKTLKSYLEKGSGDSN